MTPGKPIVGPVPFDLASALETASSEQDVEGEDDCDLEPELTDGRMDASLADSTALAGSFSFSDFLPGFLKPFFWTIDELSDLTDEGLASDPTPSVPTPEKREEEVKKFSNPTPEEVKIAKRRRKVLAKRQKRRVKRAALRETLGTRLKAISQKRAAEAQELPLQDDFVAEDLPKTKGAWSGIKETLSRAIPQLEELLGDGYKMRLVNWDGR